MPGLHLSPEDSWARANQLAKLSTAQIPVVQALDRLGLAVDHPNVEFLGGVESLTVLIGKRDASGMVLKFHHPARAIEEVRAEVAEGAEGAAFELAAWGFGVPMVEPLFPGGSLLFEIDLLGQPCLAQSTVICRGTC